MKISLQIFKNNVLTLPVYFQLTSSRWRCGSLGMCFFIQDQQWTCWSVGETMKKLERGQIRDFSLNVDDHQHIRGRWCHKPVLAEAYNAAIILIAPPLVQHAGVDNMSDGNVQVIGTQMLQQFKGLVPCCLTHQERPESFTSLNQFRTWRGRKLYRSKNVCPNLRPLRLWEILEDL